MTVEVETTGTEGEVANASQAEVTQEAQTDQEIEPSGEKVHGEGGVPAYTPNLKYKVHGQEKEFEDWVRAAIKDPDTEKKARDLFTRADGIEHVKEDRERLAEENQSIKQEWAEFNKSLEELSYYVRQDDLTTYFEKLSIPKEQVLRWALREVQMADNPQMRQQYEQQRQQQLQAYQQQTYSQQAMTQYEQAAVDLRTRELDFTLRMPETQTLAESFDTRMGKPGAFRDEIIQRGQFHWNTKGVDMPVEDLVREVAQVFGLSQAQMSQGVGRPGPSNGVVQGSRGKPVLPSIPGSGQSAVKKEIKGLAGLKQRRAELMSREG